MADDKLCASVAPQGRMARSIFWSLIVFQVDSAKINGFIFTSVNLDVKMVKKSNNHKGH